MVNNNAVPADSTTRDKVLTVSAALIGRKGFHAVGLTELCQALGISRGGFYHLFPSKEDLLEEICRRYSTELVENARTAEASESDPVARISRLGRDLVMVIGRRKDELAVCFRETQFLSPERRDAVLQIHAEYEESWEKAWRQGETSGAFVEFHRPRLRALLGMYYYSYLWLNPSNPSSLQAAADNFEHIVMSALKRADVPPHG